MCDHLSLFPEVLKWPVLAYPDLPDQHSMHQASNEGATSLPSTMLKRTSHISI